MWPTIMHFSSICIIQSAGQSRRKCPDEHCIRCVTRCVMTMTRDILYTFDLCATMEGKQIRRWCPHWTLRVLIHPTLIIITLNTTTHSSNNVTFLFAKFDGAWQCVYTIRAPPHHQSSGISSITHVVLESATSSPSTSRKQVFCVCIWSAGNVAATFRAHEKGARNVEKIQPHTQRVIYRLK